MSIIFTATCLECGQQSEHCKEVGREKGYPLEFIVDQMRCPICGCPDLHVIVDSREMREVEAQS